MPFRWIHIFDETFESIDGFPYARHYYLNNPLRLYFSPSKKYFGITGNLYHTELLVKSYVGFLINLTILLAFLFLSFQLIEYFISPVSINSGVYGSTFYMITGLHGIHVFIGTCFLIYCRTAVSTNRIVGLVFGVLGIHQTEYIRARFIIKRQKLKFRRVENQIMPTDF